MEYFHADISQISSYKQKNLSQEENKNSNMSLLLSSMENKNITSMDKVNDSHGYKNKQDTNVINKYPNKFNIFNIIRCK